MKKPKDITYCAESGAHEQPRELLASRGPAGLSDKDLLAVILGSGHRGMPVRVLAQLVLARFDRLSTKSLSPAELEGIKGLGPVRRSQLAAAHEFFRRLHLPERPRIQGPRDFLPVLDRWLDRDQEHFLCLSLNGANELIRCTVVTIGTLNRTLVHPREIFAQALRDKAASIAVAHNHPSGNVIPSDDDIEVTRRLKAAGSLMGIALMDHLIISRGAYFSFMEQGLL